MKILSTLKVYPDQSNDQMVIRDAMRKISMILFFTVLILVNYRTVVFAQQETGKKVNSVEVQLSISGHIYQGLQDRIEYSVNRVGEKLLISQPVSLLESNKQSVKKTIFNVFSKVLTGFQTDGVELVLGEHTKILINLTPLPPFIDKIDLDVQKIAPEWDNITEEASTRVTEGLNQIFAGLPVAATGWAGNILNVVINYLVEREFPGYTPSFTVNMGEITHVKIDLLPLKPVVSEVEVHYSSPNLPIWLVRAKVKKEQRQFDLLKGLPVEFLTHYQPQIEQYYADYLNDAASISSTGLTTAIELAAGIKTKIDITIDSSYYQTKLEARCFKSEDDSFANLQAYMGYKINDCEIYTRVYTGDNPDGLYKVGFSVPISTNFSGGFEYDLQKYYKTVCLNYRFERGDYLELNLGLEGHLDKALIGIFINPNLNMEFVNYDHMYGVQFMFHFW